MYFPLLLFYFLILTQGYVFIDLREKNIDGERETLIGWLPLFCTPRWLWGDGTCSLPMFPDQESNLKPFGVPDAPTSWATGLGLYFPLLCRHCAKHFVYIVSFYSGTSNEVKF